MRDIDEIIKALTQSHPGLSVEQLKVRHPGADDDGLWFFTHTSSPHQVQLESPHGMCPFLFESDANATRATADTVAIAIGLVVDGLSLPAA